MKCHMEEIWKAYSYIGKKIIIQREIYPPTWGKQTITLHRKNNIILQRKTQFSYRGKKHLPTEEKEKKSSYRGKRKRSSYRGKEISYIGKKEIHLQTKKEINIHTKNIKVITIRNIQKDVPPPKPYTQYTYGPNATTFWYFMKIFLLKLICIYMLKME